MHATQYARDALSNAKAREAVCATALPELSSRLHDIPDRDLSRFRGSLDESFPAMFTNALGYFQLKRYLYSIGAHDVVSFLEDVVHYRNIRQAQKRAFRYVGTCGGFQHAVRRLTRATDAVHEILLLHTIRQLS